MNTTSVSVAPPSYRHGRLDAVAVLKPALSIGALVIYLLEVSSLELERHLETQEECGEHQSTGDERPKIYDGMLLDLSFLSTGESQHVFLETGLKDPQWVYKIPASFGYVLPFTHRRQRFRPKNKREQLIRLISTRVPRYLQRSIDRWSSDCGEAPRPMKHNIRLQILGFGHRVSSSFGVKLLSTYCRRRNRKRFQQMLEVIEYITRHGLDDILLPYKVIKRGRALLRVDGKTILYKGTIFVQRKASFFERPSNFDLFAWHELINAEHRLWRHGVGFGTFAETVGPKNWALIDGHLRLADTGSLTRDVRVALHTLRPDRVEKKLRNSLRRIRERGNGESAEMYFQYILPEINGEKLEQLWQTDLAGRQKYRAGLGRRATEE